MSREGRCCRVFDAVFTTGAGQSFAFGYAAACCGAATRWATCRGAGDQPGLPAGGCHRGQRSISGVTRTITGRILRNADYCKRQLRDIFAPGVTGRLTVAGKYWCDAEVQRCPAISPAVLWPTFSFQLYCPNPYWHSVAKTTAATIKVTPVFRLPVCYTSHQYGIREQASYIRILNSGLDTRSWKLSLTARGEVVNPGVINPETGEYLRFITTLQDGDELQVYRENGELRVERVIDGKGYDVLSVLDGSSTLWTVYHGAQAWQRTGGFRRRLAVSVADHACRIYHDHHGGFQWLRSHPP